VVKKILSNFGIFGVILLIVGLFNYSVTGLWNWIAQVGVYGGAALLVIYLVTNFSELREWIQSRSARLGGMALATLLLGVGILALVNFLNFRHHERVDLSEGGIHGLSEQTVKVLDNLDQNIQIIAFYEDEQGARRFQDLADEYRYVSPKVTYEVIDPLKDPSRVSQYEVTRNGQVIVEGAKKKETIEEPTEEKLTNAIIKVTRDVEKKVYFLTGHGERSLDDAEGTGYSTVKQAIEKQNYQVATYNLAQENKIPEDASVLISAGPKVNLFPNEVTLLQQYLADGGKFFLLVDPENDFKMNDFLKQYGLELDDDFVVDASGLGQLFGFGAGAPLAADYSSNPITKDLQGTMTIFPAARSVRIVDSSLGYKTEELVKTSPQSWGETELKENEKVGFDEGKDRKGPLPIAAAATKEESKDAAGDQSADKGTENAEGEAANADAGAADADSTSKESRLVLFGDSDFATNSLFGTSVNGDLFLNTVSWLAEDTDLLSIRPRDPQNRSVTLTATESRLIFWATVILFPLATLIFGLGVWYRRR